MRLIDADALLKDIGNDYGCDECEASCKGCMVGKLKRNVKDAPTIKAEPVRHGKWVEQEHSDWEYSKEYRCSNCGKYRLVTNPVGWNWNYCPNCGARMDGE